MPFSVSTNLLRHLSCTRFWRGQWILRSVLRTGGEDESAGKHGAQPCQCQHDGLQGRAGRFRGIAGSVRRYSLSEVNRAINSFGVAGNPSLDLSQGSVERTGNPLDVAIEGPGYLAVQTASGTAYTRNGHLELSSTGQLVTADGNAVLGDQGPINVPPGSVSISPDGVISVNGAIAGNLRLVEFDPQASVRRRRPDFSCPALRRKRPPSLRSVKERWRRPT